MSEQVIPPSVDDLKKVGITIPTKGKVVLDIFTTWCGPCKQVGPILHDLAKKGEITLVQEDLDKNKQLGENYNIHAIPTLVFFKDGKRLGSITKGDPKELPLRDFCDQVLNNSYDFEVLQGGKPLAQPGELTIRLTKTLLKDGVMVGFCGEEMLREIISEM